MRVVFGPRDQINDANNLLRSVDVACNYHSSSVSIPSKNTCSNAKKIRLRFQHNLLIILAINVEQFP